MKNIKFIAIFAMLIGIATTAVFVGCKKEENKVVENKKIIAKEKIQKGKLTKDERGAIAGADLKGAIDGAATGATIGKTLGNTGAVVGASIGAVVGGAAASLREWREIKKAHKQTHNEEIKFKGGDVVSTILQEAENGENPYDYIGRIHYQMLYDIEMGNLFVGSEGDLDISEYYTAMEHGFLSSYEYVYDLSMLYDYYPHQFYEIFPFLQFQEVLQNSVGGIVSPVSSLSSELNNIILEYDIVRQSSTMFQDFYIYSVNIERDILMSGDFFAIEKQILLSYMATARYGFYFWNNIIEIEE